MACRIVRPRVEQSASLTFGADEKDQAAVAHDLRDEFFGSQQSANRFADVDDVNLVLTAVNIGPHFWIPAAGTVPEVHASFDQFLDDLIGHKFSVGSDRAVDGPREPCNMAGTPWREQTEKGLQ